MTRLLTILLLLGLSSCTNSHRSDPPLLTQANNDTVDAIQAFNHANWERAQRLFKQALRQYQSIDDLSGILQSYINLVELNLSQQHDVQALDYLNKARMIADDPTLFHYRSRLTYLYARCALQQKQLAKARILLQGLLPDFKQNVASSKLTYIQLSALVSRVKLAFILNQDRVIWVGRLNNALQKAENMPYLARLLRFQAILQVEQHQVNQAEQSLQQALKWYKQNLHRFGMAMTLYELGQLYLNHLDKPKAKSYLVRSLNIFHALGDKPRQQQVKKILGYQ